MVTTEFHSMVRSNYNRLLNISVRRKREKHATYFACDFFQVPGAHRLTQTCGVYISAASLSVSLVF